MRDKFDEDPDLDPQAQADQLEERLIDFAVRIINLSNELPKTPAGKHISGQILSVVLLRRRIMAKRGELRVEQTSFTK